jgi:hypothetical protein
MECHDVQKTLQAFLDGEVTPDEGEKISAHLDSCAECRAEFEKLRTLDRMVAENQGLDPGPEIWERMRANVRKEISKQPRSERSGIMEWIQWLLSPRYAVVKVGAALALVVLAFVISRELPVSRFTPSHGTVPESAISSRSLGKMGESKVPDKGVLPQDIKGKVAEQKASEPIPPQPGEPGGMAPTGAELPAAGAAAMKAQERSEKKAPTDLSQGSEESKVIESEEPYMAEDETAAKPDRSLDELPPVVEDTLRKSRLQIAPMGEVLQKLPGVHAEEEGEFHFRGGRSSPLQTVRSTQQKEAPSPQHETVVMSADKAAASRDMESLLSQPFSKASYWQMYNVTLPSSLHAETDLDSLRIEYNRCAGQPCEQEVAPYLVEAMFFRAVKTENGDDIRQAKQYMTQYENLLKSTWGSQRYQVRWAKISVLEKR